MRLYKISVSYENEVKVVELMIKKETDKTVTASDGFMAWTVRKTDLPFNWRNMTLITSDPVEGRKEWNRKTNQMIESNKADIETWTKWLVKEL
jgi:hypothetical protein